MIVKCEDKRFKKRYLEGEIVYTYSYNCNSITPRGIVILTEDTPSTSAWPYLAKHERSIVQIIALPNSKEKEEWRVKHPKLRDYFREIDKGRGYRIC